MSGAGKATERALLWAIAWCADEHGWATPGAIAFQIYGVSRDGRAVVRPLKRLVAAGLVEHGPIITGQSGTFGLTGAGDAARREAEGS